ncbi:hypothetical protein IQ277_05340 [Nostocales cyanobacterium LEGE 12452]|nr:hypothetical protein [Nostocales cyanobacterium LEGE 12452]
MKNIKNPDLIAEVNGRSPNVDGIFQNRSLFFLVNTQCKQNYVGNRQGAIFSYAAYFRALLSYVNKYNNNITNGQLDLTNKG